MTPQPPKGERKGITVSKVFIVAAAVAAAGTVLFGLALGHDLDNHDHTPDRLTLAAMIFCATAWAAFISACLNEASERRTKRVEENRDQLIWGIADRLDKIDENVTALARRTDKALVVIHDEINKLGEGHTEELHQLAQLIQDWGEEQETRGELAGLRRAVGIASVETPTKKGSVRHLHPTN